jgi:hypothetical protein
MTESELRQKFETAYRIIQRERKMRVFVFRHDPTTCAQKLAEIDKLLEIVTELKDFCKEHVEAGYEQPLLLDAPKKADYQ